MATKRRPGPKRTPVLVRALARIEPDADDSPLGSPCWRFRGESRRGRAVIGDRDGAPRSVVRILYDALIEKVAPRARLRSACGRTSCCNPLHRRVVGALALACLLATPSLASQPTIVLIVADDMAVSDLAATPSIRSIAERGASFDAALTPFPLCSPSRTSLLTGLAPRTHGVYANDAALFDPSWPTLGTRLGAAGYRTALIGKLLNRVHNLRAPLGGWDEYRPLAKHSDFESDQSTVLANRASNFLRDAARDGVPAFVYLAPVAPHGPNRGPSPECDAPTMLPQDGTVDDRTWFRRMSSLCGLDRLVEKIDRVAGPDAYVVVLSDNGWMQSNGRTGKHETVLGAVRVPLAIRGPGIAAGRVREEIVTLMDVHATVLALAGVAPSGDGRSLTQLLGVDANDEPEPWTPTVVIESVPPTGLARRGAR